MKRDSSMMNAFVPGNATLSPDAQKLVERRERTLGPAYRLFYSNPVHVVRGEGVWLYGESGERYLDAYNNVVPLGHCHPHVVEAMAQQASVLCTNTRYLNDIILNYSERLIATFPSDLRHVMFTCTGSESNDLAMRIAQAHTGGTGFIITEFAYHGLTQAVSGISPTLGRYVSLGQHVRTVPAPNAYRGNGGDVGDALASAVTQAAEDLLRHGIKPAALIVDTIFSSDGVLAAPAGFLRKAVEAIRNAGGLFIADEVQAGFGRTGDAMWGFQRHGVLPDLVTLGKPMGNGYPVAGVVMKPEVIADFGKKARYFNTFGGNTVACATGLAVLEVIERNRLVENARTVGSYFAEALGVLAQKFAAIGDVRQAGLFLGVEFVSDRKTRAPDSELALGLVNDMRERRILISTTGPEANVLKIRPPLIFTKANVDFFVKNFSDALAARNC